MRQISPERRLYGARISAGIRMIVECVTDTVSPSIETTAASSPRQASIIGLGPAQK